MKLFLIHAGFYDDNVSGGFYESHTNYFVVATDVKQAKQKAKAISEYKDKKMHIDGIKEIDVVDGYRISLHENIDGSTLDNSDYSYDEVKKM